MKKVTCAVFIYTMMIFLVNPLSKDTQLPVSNACLSGCHSYGVQ
jgi:hypothetical protein